MKRMIGLGLFIIALGMLLMLFVSNRLIGIILILLLLFAGYTLYNCD